MLRESQNHHSEYQAPISQFQKECAFLFQSSQSIMIQCFIQIPKNFVRKDFHNRFHRGHFYRLEMVNCLSFRTCIDSLHWISFLHCIRFRSKKMYRLSFCAASHWLWLAHAVATFRIFKMRKNSNPHRIFVNQKHTHTEWRCLAECQPNLNIHIKWFHSIFTLAFSRCLHFFTSRITINSHDFYSCVNITNHKNIEYSVEKKHFQY